MLLVRGRSNKNCKTFFELELKAKKELNMKQAEKWEVERLYFTEGLSTEEIASEIGLYETDIIYYLRKMIKDSPRREEIRAAAEKAYTKGYICEGSIPIFVQGAMWADRTMLDKACEWLKENGGTYWMDDYDLPTDELVKDFEKYMKGELSYDK